MVMSTQPQSDHLTIAAGEFKAKCLQLMNDVEEKKLTITVTKRGRPVGQFVPMPAEEKPFRSIVGRSPGVKVPADFAKLKAALALDWVDPGEKWARANSGKRKKQ